MLSTDIHQDLTKYEGKVFAGLSRRTLACASLAIAASVAVGAGSWLLLGVPFDYVAPLAMMASMPFWALGFAKIEGMPFERWLPLMWRHWTAGNRMTYANRGRFAMGGLADSRRTNVTKVYRRLSRRRGIELWEPGERDE
ncbi:MAG: PrgI family protein [Atopobiaceae bacterium]|nr:PrgI family protein [Atopobiaceae bacterium]